MQQYIFDVISTEGQRYEVHVNSDCQENARREVIGRAIAIDVWVKSLALWRILPPDVNEMTNGQDEH